MPKYLKCGRFVNDITIFVFKDSKTRKKFINEIATKKFKWYKYAPYSQLTYNQLETLNYEYFNLGDE